MTQNLGYSLELAAMLTAQAAGYSNTVFYPRDITEEDIKGYAELQEILGQAISEVEGSDELDITDKDRHKLLLAVKSAKTNITLFLTKLVVEKTITIKK